jgi:hypothetical protein
MASQVTSFRLDKACMGVPAATTATTVADPDPPKMLAPAMTIAVTDVSVSDCPVLASPIPVFE